MPVARSSSFARLAIFLSAVVVGVSAQQGTFPATPLASKHFAYPTGIPYQADTDTNLIRGSQTGYNLCNSTTEGQKSLCQTSFINSIDDFCLWGPIDPDSLIQDTEGEEVAWCTKKGRGTRLIPDGALQGVQFMRTPDYVQVVGFIDQSKMNIKTGDTGGELDPHGADLRGNPLGGLMYSNAWSNNDVNKFTQVMEWHNFIGSGFFCLKACDPNGPAKNAAGLCQHIYDRIGCQYNAPNAAKNGTFESCLGDNQDPPGIYTSNGQVVTYTQPPESLGPISSMPYDPKVPASSQCTPFTSAAIYTDGPKVAGASGSGSVPANPTPSGSGGTKPSGAASGSKSGSGASPSATGQSSASSIGVSLVSTVAGTIFAAVFLS